MPQVINEEALLLKRTPSWSRLAFLSQRASSSIASLSGPELFEFIRLYRQASADLGFLQTHSSNQEVVDYLNTLVARSYGALYRSPTKPFLSVLWETLQKTAVIVRRQSLFILLSIVLLLGSAGSTFALISYNPNLRDYYVSPSEEELFSKWKEGKFDARSADQNLEMTSMYAGHNPVVGIMTNSISASTFGLGTLFLIYETGKQIGALSWDMNSVGKLGFLLSSIFPHGVSEIGGFMVASGAGFVMAVALIAPGRRSRGEALRLASKDAVYMMGASLVMIFCAAPIEGFFSFNPAIPQWAKVVVGCLALAAWLSFFIGFGREHAVPAAAKPA